MMGILALTFFGLVVPALSFSMDGMTSSPASPPVVVEVHADQFFHATGIFTSRAESFLVIAKLADVVDLSTLNGGYLTGADGTIVVTPPL
jgi:hypothetical protein